MTQQVQNNSLGRRAWRFVRTQKFTMLCFMVIVAYLLIALVGALGLLPDHRIEVGPSYTAPALAFLESWVPIFLAIRSCIKS